MTNSNWYLEAIKHELEKLSTSFTGNIEFKMNFKEGSIANMNVVMGKSIKQIEQR